MKKKEMYCYCVYCEKQVITRINETKEIETGVKGVECKECGRILNDFNALLLKVLDRIHGAIIES